jgi:hypothetical protein
MSKSEPEIAVVNIDATTSDLVMAWGFPGTETAPVMVKVPLDTVRTWTTQLVDVGWRHRGGSITRTGYA